MKLPNGCGGVTKLSGKRRKPWMARVTLGWELTDGVARQKRVVIGYYETKQKALESLMAYTADPYDLESQGLTFASVYDMWSAEYFQNIVPSAQRTIKSAYNHSKSLWNIPMKDLRVAHLEGAINDAEVSSHVKSRMKSMYNLMYKYALKHEIVNKDYAAMCNAVKTEAPTINRMPFSQEEIFALWSNVAQINFVDMILIGIYSGWRPQELATLKVADIDLDNDIMKGGMKTEAGKNRIVPIHPLIKPLIASRIESAQKLNSLYLFNDEDGQQGTYMTYDKYRHRWDKVMDRLHLTHRPHDTRHTFITLAKNAGMDEYIIKLIVGHAIRDITEKTYTHRQLEELKAEIKKIQ